MAQTISNKSKKESPDLRKHYTYGLSLLQLMLLLGVLGLTLIGLYEFCSGGTAG